MLDRKEMNMPPEEFQERLTYLGGVNRYDEPNFRIWWSQYGYGDGSFRSGGVWSVDEKYFLGYRDLLRGSGEPCYCLGQWHAPEEYGTPESYYISNIDDATNLQILGEYPYSGRVELLYQLRWYEHIDGKMEFFTLPLNTTTFDLIVPIIIAAKDVSLEKRKAAYVEAKARDEAERTKEIERHLRDQALPFTSAVSYSRQGIRTTAVDQKMLAMQRQWGDLAKAAKGFKKGLQTR